MNKIYYFLFIFSLLFLFSFVSAKSYTLDKANIDMVINSDSSISVSEAITYTFYGNYTYAYRDFPKGNWDLENISVFDGDLKLNSEIITYSDYTQVKWFYNASNETKTYVIKYTLKNAIKSYDDVSELNWKLWGDGWELPLKEIFATIYLPGETTPEKVYTYGHPKLDGKIGMLDNDKIILQAFNINSNQFVELRLAFPSELLLSKEFSQVISGNGLQKIIEEEANYGKLDWMPFILSLILFFILIFIAIKISKSEKSDFKDVYFRDIPYSYSPAIVSYLLSFGTPGANISAEVLNLCLKKKMQIEKISKTSFLGKDDYKFIIIDSTNKGLSKSEEFIFDKLKEAAKCGYDNYVVFKKEKVDATHNELLLSEFKIFMQKRKLENSAFVKKWQDLVKVEAIENKINFKHYGIVIVIASLMLLIIIGMLLLKNNLFLIYFVFLIPLFFVKKFFIKFDLETDLQYSKWNALKKYLNHFSDFNNKEIMDIKLWERYLVYAIPLGVAKKVQKNMKLVFENYTGKTNSTIFVVGSISVSDLASINSDFSNAFSSAMANSGASGFSGGSSGGGGGGGGGAG